MPWIVVRIPALLLSVVLALCAAGAAHAAPIAPTAPPQPGQIDGILRVLHGDTPEGEPADPRRTPVENGLLAYALDTNAASDERPGQLLRIDGLVDPLEIAPNALVRVTGTIAPGHRLVVAGPQAIALRPTVARGPGTLTRPALRNDLLRDRTLLVVVVDFDDVAGALPTQADVRQAIFLNPDSPSRINQLSSYGQTKYVGIVNPQGDVTPPVTVHETGDKCESLGETAIPQLAGLGYDYDAYDDVTFVLPGLTACPWAGLGMVGAKGSWIADDYWSSAYRTVAHELGHNSGLLHSSSVQCLPQPGTRIPGADETAPTCPLDEYGNPNSLMGAGDRDTGYDGLERARLGWMPRARTGSIQQSGTYRIATVDTASPAPGDRQLMSIFRDQGFTGSNRYLYVELRSPHGNAAPVNSQWKVGRPGTSLAINLGQALGQEEYVNDVIVDQHPNVGAPYADDFGLLTGETFTDAHTGIKVKLDGIDPDGSHATFTVTLPDGWQHEGAAAGGAWCNSIQPAINPTSTVLSATKVRIAWESAPCGAAVRNYVVSSPQAGWHNLPAGQQYVDDLWFTPGEKHTYEVLTTATGTDGRVYTGARPLAFSVTMPQTASPPGGDEGGDRVPNGGGDETGEDEEWNEEDTTAPSRVVGLKRGKVTRTSIAMSWKPAKDDVGVVRYDVWQVAARGRLVKVATVRGRTTVVIRKLRRATAYAFVVAASDAAGNTGARSARVAMRTAR